MATAKDFAQIENLNGVASYIMVRGDGHVVGENMEADPALSATIINCGKTCNSLAGDMNDRRHIHLCITRSSGNNLLIFSLGKYYLGVIQHNSVTTQEVADNVINFLKTLH